jgi:hypothetical protein
VGVFLSPEWSMRLCARGLLPREILRTWPQEDCARKMDYGVIVLDLS